MAGSNATHARVFTAHWIRGALGFEGKKLVVIGDASGVGLKVAENVIAEGGSAVIVGRTGQKLDDAVASLSRSGSAWSIAADLADRDQVVEAQKRLAEDHPDATLLVNSAGFCTRSAGSAPRRTWPPRSSSSSLRPPAGPRAPFSTSTAESWQAATSHTPHARPETVTCPEQGSEKASINAARA